MFHNYLMLAGSPNRPIDWLVSLGTVLIIGILFLRLVREPQSGSRYWIPLVAIIGGPLSMMLYFVLDVFLISRDYTTTKDYLDSFYALVSIGLVAGILGGIGLWLGDKLRLPRTKTTLPESEAE